ncbi:MAG: sodium-translocating pyrophosphatase [Proteobacteria bacterium]|nr:sodium-translocating pyrophosphatase [Pseudomonadota bacterium]
MTLDQWLVVAIAAGLLGILFGVFQTSTLMKASAGNDRMKEIAAAIQEGASAYLRRQYTTIAIVGVVIFVAALLLIGVWAAIGFLIGAILSGAAGYAGMLISVRANVRTAQAASESLSRGLSMAFQSGAVTGLFVAGGALLGVAGYYFFLTRGLNLDINDQAQGREIVDAMVALGFGASLISIFARLGGGIFTKGADVGGDMVGKVEAGIPEDDPRNAATIADNVGDNVGDCAGMAADLFETYAVTTVATMVLASIFFRGTPDVLKMIMLPLGICATCIVTSIIGTFFVRLGKSQNIMGALYRGLIVTGVLSVGALWFVINSIAPDGVTQADNYHISAMSLFWCGLVGLAVTTGIVVITEYYTGTGFRPVKAIAKASQAGHGTNVIAGLAVSLESTALPALTIIIGIVATYQLAGLFGVAVATTTMLALAGMIVALDAFGPVTDNAGGIAEMAGLPSEVRVSTDALDAVGNTTKAVTKGYAIGSAGLGALVLFAAYTSDLDYFSKFPTAGGFFDGLGKIDFALTNPYVVVGLLFGGLLPFLFGGMSMTAVGRAAESVVAEVRRQFREMPGIMTYETKPEYGKAVDILTKAAIKEMMIPSLLPVLSPIVLFVVVLLVTQSKANAFAAVGAMLMGVIVTGLFVAISMTSGGGAWDNAKKYIEEGNFGGKGSEAHKAAVTGDTVGDPYKDTAGPAVNPMIKITNIVALLLLAVLASGKIG